MSYLLDTNIILELRKRRRCNVGVAKWFATLEDQDIFLSVLVIGEIRKGIESIRRRDSLAAGALDNWLSQLVITFSERIIPVDRRVAETWGRLNVPNPLPVIDGLLAATALVKGFTLVTRNVSDIEATGVPYLNPFTDAVDVTG